MMTPLRSFKTTLLALLVMLAVHLAFILFSQPATSQAQGLIRTHVMYKVVHVRCEEQEIQTAVDVYAHDGWELVSHYNEILIFRKD